MNWKAFAAGAVVLGFTTACSTEGPTVPQATSLPTLRFDHGVTGPLVTPSLIVGNPTCAQLGFDNDLKVDPPINGDYPVGSPIVSVTFHTNGEMVNFESTIQIGAVLVKGGPNANLYDYRPAGQDHDNNLVSPDHPSPGQVPQISHVNFCYNDGGIIIVGDPEVSGLKYYDANVNGQWDPLEPGIPNWQIQYDNGSGAVTILTGLDGTFSFTASTGDSYTVGEVQASNWIQTGNTVDQASPASVDLTNFLYTFTAENNTPVTGLNFGNVCVGVGGGHTLGFWSNKNGQALIDTDDLAALVALNLRNANGSHFNPGSKSLYRTWLLSANATNMAYMLSAQLSAMVLNVREGFVDGDALVYAPDVDGASVTGFITINALIAAADASLGSDGETLSDDPNRAEQQDLKNALDSANNNVNFLQGGPADCAAPIFPVLE